MVRARRARKWTRKCVQDRSGEAALENGTQSQKYLFFAAKPLTITAHAVGGTIIVMVL
jgi:hypothetical protein